MLWPLLSCSLGTFPQLPCESNAVCRDAFGWGWTCESDGLCGEVSSNNRCATLPDDLFRNKADYAESIVLGSVYDRDAFPLEVSEILNLELPATIPGPLAEPDPDPEAGWPATFDAAMAGMEPVPLADALELVLVSWPPERDLPPVLSVGGRPSGMIDARSTLDVVNGWLRNAGVRLAN